MELLFVGLGLLIFALIGMFCSKQDDYTTGKIVSIVALIFAIGCILLSCDFSNWDDELFNMGSLKKGEQTMNTVFPYGNWVWCVITGESDTEREQNDGFIIAETEKEAEKILEQDLKTEMDISFEYNDGQFEAILEDGTKLWTYVEPLNCLNPEACGN